MVTLKTITTDSIKDFVTKSLETYSGKADATATAEKTAEVVYGILEERGLISQHASQTFVDVLLAAAFLHDVFRPESGEGFTWLFDAREMLPEIAEETGLPEQIQDAIFDAIEAQMGEKTPVAACRPKPGTPQEMFAYAVWFTNRYLV